MQVLKAGILLIVLSYLITILIYPNLPQTISIHWDTNSQVNGTADKLSIFLLPLIMTILFVILIHLPKLDPLSKSSGSLPYGYDVFIMALIIFLLYIHILSIIWNVGYRFNFTQFLSPAFALLFFSLSILFEKIERNWFIGIRTPWTLTSDIVWKKTHSLASALFKMISIISLIGLLIPNFLLIIVPPLVVGFICIIYSYWIYKKLN